MPDIIDIFATKLKIAGFSNINECTLIINRFFNYLKYSTIKKDL